MKVIGSTHKGAVPVELVADTKRVARYAVPLEVLVPKLTLYVDGLGSGSGDQVVRGVIYDSVGVLRATSDQVTIHDGQAGGWVDLPFSAYPGGVPLVAASYDFGVISGGNTNSARVYGDSPSP